MNWIILIVTKCGWRSWQFSFPLNDVCSITPLERGGNRIQAMLACIQKWTICELCYRLGAGWYPHRIQLLTPYPPAWLCGDLAGKEVVKVKWGHCRQGRRPAGLMPSQEKEEAAETRHTKAIWGHGDDAAVCQGGLPRGSQPSGGLSWTSGLQSWRNAAEVNHLRSLVTAPGRLRCHALSQGSEVSFETGHRALCTIDAE